MLQMLILRRILLFVIESFCGTLRIKSGTALQIPDTKENVPYFGCKKNQSDTQTALASASTM